MPDPRGGRRSPCRPRPAPSRAFAPRASTAARAAARSTRAAQGAAPQAHQESRLPALARHLRALGPHAAAPQRGPRDAAALRAHLRGVARAAAAAGRHAACRSAFLQLERNRQYWRRLPYPAPGRPGELPRQRDPVPVLPRRGAPAPPALHLQEGQPPARLLRAQGAHLRRGGAAPHPRRDDRARGEARARLHRLGVPVLLRRRLAARG